jgi:hypothetical protein
MYSQLDRPHPDESQAPFELGQPLTIDFCQHYHAVSFLFSTREGSCASTVPFDNRGRHWIAHGADFMPDL